MLCPYFSELTLNGQLLKSGGEYMMGAEVTTRLGYEGPNAGIPPLVTKIVKAGEYHAIGTDLQGMSEAQLQGLKTQLET
ncbi:MAG TPA: hypothetical protein VFW49_12545, partial [Fluviicoccus sp.]|nr:hypothetical protein [Fluviicoccus sp.]